MRREYFEEWLELLTDLVEDVFLVDEKATGVEYHLGVDFLFVFSDGSVELYGKSLGTVHTARHKKGLLMLASIVTQAYAHRSSE